MRLNIGGRVDKFGNLDEPRSSRRGCPRIFKLAPDHSLRVSFNRAFQSPSVVNNYLERDDHLAAGSERARAAAAARRCVRWSPRRFRSSFARLAASCRSAATPQPKLTEESLTAYEVAYTGTIMAKTTIGASFYVNDLNHSINFVQLPTNLDPYTAANPPPGWQLPPSILAAMAQLGIFLPRTAFTYQNLGPLRQKGVELSLDHRVDENLSLFANYSWQGTPQILARIRESVSDRGARVSADEPVQRRLQRRLRPLSSATCR